MLFRTNVTGQPHYWRPLPEDSAGKAATVVVDGSSILDVLHSLLGKHHKVFCAALLFGQFSHGNRSLGSELPRGLRHRSTCFTQLLVRIFILGVCRQGEAPHTNGIGMFALFRKNLSQVIGDFGALAQAPSRIDIPFSFTEVVLLQVSPTERIPYSG
jgi:hypothetical protein